MSSTVLVDQLIEAGDYWPTIFLLVDEHHTEFASSDHGNLVRARANGLPEVAEFASIFYQNGRSAAFRWAVSRLKRFTSGHPLLISTYAAKQLLDIPLAARDWDLVTEQEWSSHLMFLATEGAAYRGASWAHAFLIDFETRVPESNTWVHLELKLALARSFMNLPAHEIGDRPRAIEEAVELLQEAFVLAQAGEYYTYLGDIHFELGRAYLSRIEADPLWHFTDSMYQFELALQAEAFERTTVHQIHWHIARCHLELALIAPDQPTKLEASRMARARLATLVSANLNATWIRSELLLATWMSSEPRQEAFNTIDEQFRELIDNQLPNSGRSLIQTSEWYGEVQESNEGLWARYRYAQMLFDASSNGVVIDASAAISRLEPYRQAFETYASCGEMMSGSTIIGDLYLLAGNWPMALELFTSTLTNHLGTSIVSIAGRESMRSVACQRASKIAFCLAMLDEPRLSILAADEAAGDGILAESRLVSMLACYPSDGSVRDAIEQLRTAEAQSRLPLSIPNRPSSATTIADIAAARSVLAQLDIPLQFDPPSHSERADELDRQVDEGVAVLMHTSTAAGSVVVLATDGPVGPRYGIELIPASDRQVDKAVEAYANFIASVRARLPERSYLDSAASIMQETLGNPAARLLDRLNVAEGKKVVLLGNSPLSLLPVHLLLSEGGEEPSWLVDKFTIAVCPGLGLAAEVQRRRTKPAVNQGRILVVSNPTRDLPFSEIEAATVVAAAGSGSAQLVGRQATKDRIVALAPEYDSIHFATHAVGDLNVAWRSSIRLADGEIPAARLMSNVGEMAGWAMLSGCETGWTDLERGQSERSGLVAAFAATGCSHVIASAWPVNDFSACLYVSEMYRLVFEDRLSPPAAARRAALWLRQATSQELLQRVLEIQKLLSLKRLRNWKLRLVLLHAQIRLRRWNEEQPPLGDYLHWGGYAPLELSPSSS